jgi:hypothetical protein
VILSLPFISVTTAELLQIVIADACANGLLSLLINESYEQRFPILQDADNNQLIMRADHVQLLILKIML